MKILLLLATSIILLGSIVPEAEARKSGSTNSASKITKVTKKPVNKATPKYTKKTPIIASSNKKNEKRYYGTCTSLRKLKIGNFTRDSINYSKQRDKDDDLIGCDLKKIREN